MKNLRTERHSAAAEGAEVPAFAYVRNEDGSLHPCDNCGYPSPLALLPLTVNVYYCELCAAFYSHLSHNVARNAPGLGVLAEDLQYAVALESNKARSANFAANAVLDQMGAFDFAWGLPEVRLGTGQEEEPSSG